MRIVVHLEGGIVQSVSIDEPVEAEAVVIDYDSDSYDETEIHHVPQSDNDSDVRNAYVGFMNVGRTDRPITKYLNKVS